jgi:hypothetical protein
MARKSRSVEARRLERWTVFKRCEEDGASPVQRGKQSYSRCLEVFVE